MSDDNIEGLADLALRGALELMARRVGEGMENGANEISYLGCYSDTGGLWWTNAGKNWSPDARALRMEILAFAEVEGVEE